MGGVFLHREHHLPLALETRVERLHGLLPPDEDRVGRGRERHEVAQRNGRIASGCSGRAAAAPALSRRPAWIRADSVFQSAAPSILETSSRLSLWLTVRNLAVRIRAASAPWSWHRENRAW